MTAVPRSRDEIGVLARAMNDMARALRDRDFIRETLGRYVSPELAQEVLRDREAMQMGGEVRDVAMLMSDLRGFSELSERLGPAAMIGLLNRYLARMTPVILQHRGVINEFIGDAIFVLFGAPFSRPDDPERAVRCAWAMQEALAAFNLDSRLARPARAEHGHRAARGAGRGRQHRQSRPREVRRGGAGRQPDRAHPGPDATAARCSCPTRCWRACRPSSA